MSNYSRVQDNLDCVADDFEHEVEVNDNENDSATIVTGGNKRKKSSSSKPLLPRKKMVPRSTVWQHFTRLPNDDTKCKCNYYGQEFECGTVGVKTWRDDGLVLNRDYLHVRCCAHILNLIVTEGLKELEQSMVSVRNAVKYVRSSTARMQAFQIRVQQEKINCRGIVILDCPTSAKCVEMKEMVKHLLIKLYESYNVQYKPGGSGSASGNASGSTSGSQNLAIGSGSGSNFWDLGDDDDVMIEDPFSEFSKAVAVSEGSPELSNELDLYLMEKTEKIAKSNLGTKFDILLSWRVNSANYPILSSIARDVLAIPMSTVAFESSFSTGGRILDQYRSSLTPDMVEALVLLQNWLQTSLFVDTTADINKLVEDNEFMDQLAEGIFCKTLI
ncbi:hypothetical protein KPL71_014240 [Citrus sinensis]|uniref:Uncharacterized protein n=1 Tax=Citrus sinensis TaxID=2711 RepID=A0ACB8KA72_CITSI|nr:hypothetical protein KPL71_014240 [Citrus sinensis]